MSLAGILWDYDNTLVDSSTKNMHVTIEILKQFMPEKAEMLPSSLTDPKEYLSVHAVNNWREAYTAHFGFTQEQLDEAVLMWGPEQAKNTEVSPMFPGMDEVLRSMDAIPMAICSLNSNDAVDHSLRYYGVRDCIDKILGYDDLPKEEQKPHEAGFLRCVAAFDPAFLGGTYVYIGDHRDDITFAKNAQEVLRKIGPYRVIGITIDHFGLYDDQGSGWIDKPDHYVRNADELIRVLKQL